MSRACCRNKGQHTGLSQASMRSLSPATSLSMESVRTFCRVGPLGLDPCLAGTQASGSSTLSEWKVMESWPLHQVSLNGPENTTDTLVLSSFLGCTLGPEAVSPFPAGPLAFRGLAEPEQKAPRGPKWVRLKCRRRRWTLLSLFRNRLPASHGKTHKNEKMGLETAILSR